MLEITTNWKLDQVFSIPVPWVKNLKKTIGMVFWTYWSGKRIWWLRITETNFTMTTSSTSRSITRYPTPFCDTGKIVLLENRPLLKFIRKFFRDSTGFYFTHPTSKDIDAGYMHIRIYAACFYCNTRFTRYRSCPSDNKKKMTWRLGEIILFVSVRRKYITRCARSFILKDIFVTTRK